MFVCFKEGKPNMEIKFRCDNMEEPPQPVNIQYNQSLQNNTVLKMKYNQSIKKRDDNLATGEKSDFYSKVNDIVEGNELPQEMPLSNELMPTSINKTVMENNDLPSDCTKSTSGEISHLERSILKRSEEDINLYSQSCALKCTDESKGNSINENEANKQILNIIDELDDILEDAFDKEPHKDLPITSKDQKCESKGPVSPSKKDELYDTFDKEPYKDLSSEDQKCESNGAASPSKKDDVEFKSSSSLTKCISSIEKYSLTNNDNVFQKDLQSSQNFKKLRGLLDIGNGTDVSGEMLTDLNENNRIETKVSTCFENDFADVTNDINKTFECKVQNTISLLDSVIKSERDADNLLVNICIYILKLTIQLKVSILKT